MGSGSGSIGRSAASKHQRSAVRIQSPANFYKKIICLHIVNCVEIIKIKEKEAGIGPFKNYLDR